MLIFLFETFNYSFKKCIETMFIMYKYFHGPAYTCVYLCIFYISCSVTNPVPRLSTTVHLLLSSSLSCSSLMLEFYFLLFFLYFSSLCPVTSLYVVSTHPFGLSYPFANTCIVLLIKIAAFFPTFSFLFPQICILVLFHSCILLLSSIHLSKDFDAFLMNFPKEDTVSI